MFDLYLLYPIALCFITIVVCISFCKRQKKTDVLGKVIREQERVIQERTELVYEWFEYSKQLEEKLKKCQEEHD